MSSPFAYYRLLVLPVPAESADSLIVLFFHCTRSSLMRSTTLINDDYIIYFTFYCVVFKRARGDFLASRFILDASPSKIIIYRVNYVFGLRNGYPTEKRRYHFGWRCGFPLQCSDFIVLSRMEMKRVIESVCTVSERR